MSEWHRTKSLSKGKMICNDGLKNKRSANSLHFSWEFRAVFNQRKSSCKRTRCLTKISPKKITSKKNKRSSNALHSAREEDRLNVNRTAKNSLVLINVLMQPYSLINYRIKFNLQRKR